MAADEAKVIVEISEEFHQKLSARLSNELSRGKITIPQYNTLFTLKKQGAMTMSELAESLGVTTAATTPLVDRLVEMQLVNRERSQKDRRVVRVIPTGRGNKIVAGVQKEIYGLTTHLLNRLEAGERSTLAEIYRKMHRFLQEEVREK